MYTYVAIEMNMDLIFVRKRRGTYLCETRSSVPASWMSAFLHLLKCACLQEVINKGKIINRGMD